MDTEEELESCVEALHPLLQHVHVNTSDQVYMRSVYLARILDTIDDIDELKLILLSKLIDTDNRLTSLECQLR